MSETLAEAEIEHQRLIEEYEASVRTHEALQRDIVDAQSPVELLRLRDAELASVVRLVQVREAAMRVLQLSAARPDPFAAAGGEWFPIGADHVAVHMPFGAWIVVDTLNMDVVPYIWHGRNYEPYVKLLIDAHAPPGATVVDVGANFGYHTFYARHRVGTEGKVFAFEANPHIFVSLIRSTMLSSATHNVDLFCRAVAETSGETLLLNFDRNYAGGGSILSTVEQYKPSKRVTAFAESAWSPEQLPAILDERGRWDIASFFGYVKEPVTTVALDDALADKAGRIDFMKMDIEGGEAGAILGGRKLIKASPDLKIVMEWTPFHMENPVTAAGFDRMWRFLLEEEKFRAWQIWPDWHATELDQVLRPLDGLDDIMRLPHGDVFLQR